MIKLTKICQTKSQKIGKGIKNENKKPFDLFSFNIIEDPSINSDLEMAFDFPESYQELVLDVDDETYYNHFIRLHKLIWNIKIGFCLIILFIYFYHKKYIKSQFFLKNPI